MTASTDGAAALPYTGQRFVSFRVNGADFRWIDVLTFDVARTASDEELLAALIGNPWYSHTYAAPREKEPEAGEIHGPYLLDHITVPAFRRRERSAVADRIWAWALSEGELPPELLSAIGAEVRAIEAADSDVWELPDLGAGALHEWGGVVGTAGFIEFVAVSRKHGMLTLLVASDD
ncbi:hypothetical protein [Curtobacterium sp. MCLR17_054]|uniref:hypothetical protein n=1 Tax=Curtobacterium sp. MCLR17_054 TaxID=2175632 RepID=UPI000DA7DF10|nr:hypothetical protein [Curtobacterium sp. MCLR17_054]WIE67551.1 hypothetical protein DEJ08_013720 [Curtobacterium sp. MCLR17_054]